MIKQILIRFWQVVETWRRSGLKALIRKTFPCASVIVPTRKNLESAISKADLLKKKGLSLIEISSDCSDGHDLRYPLRSRQLKRDVNTARGYRNFVMARGNEVVGDIWFALPGATGHPSVHPDADDLGIQIGNKDVYLFDAYITPDQRGKALVAPFLLTCLAALRDKGYEWAYGFYEQDNTPALWMHRMLKYEELPARELTDLILYHRSSPATVPATSARS